MSDIVTIARPYAKAIFEHALSKNKLSQWSTILSYLSVVAVDENAAQFITNPSVPAERYTELLTADSEQIAGSEREEMINFVKLLSVNKRLLTLPNISRLYEELRAEEEKTIQVEVTSFSELSMEQERELIQKLKGRLSREITLNVNIDKSLLGGAIIKAGDLVIDGSVLGKLNKLHAILAA